MVRAPGGSQVFSTQHNPSDFARVANVSQWIGIQDNQIRCLSFLNNPERVISRTELLNEVWGYNNYPTTRTVDTHILRLRQKLERDPTDPVHFRTVHGTGYKFVR